MRIPLLTQPLLWLSMAVLLAGATMAWWALSGFGNLSADPLRDACTDHYLDYDAIVDGYSPEDGWTTGVATMKVSSNGEKQDLFRDGVLVLRVINILRNPLTLPTPTPQNFGRSTTQEPRLFKLPFTQYTQLVTSDGRVSEWMGEHDSNEKADRVAFFCGHSVDLMHSITEGGSHTINGISSTKYSVVFKPASDDPATSLYDMTWEVFVSGDGKLVREIQWHPYSDTKRRVTYSGWGEANTITAPPQAVFTDRDLRLSVPTPIGGTPSSTVTPTPTPTATTAPSPTLAPTATPGPTSAPPQTPEPSATPTHVPASPDAWLEPNPEDFSHNRQWRQYTLHAQGIQELDLSTNVYNPSGPSSTGAVELTSNRTLPSPADACERTYYTGYTVTPGYSFSLVGCTPGTVIIDISDPSNDYAVIRRYTLTVTSGP